MSITRSLSSRMQWLLGSTRGRIGLVTLIALFAGVFAYTRAQAASCATGFSIVVPPSCFEGGDGDTAATAFEEMGWGWGGRWTTAKDWMHFSSNGR